MCYTLFIIEMTTYTQRMNELVNQIEEGLLVKSEAITSLAGFLLKLERNPVITHGLTPSQHAFYNASSDINSEIKDRELGL